MPNLIASILSIVRGSRVAVDTHRASPLGLVLARVPRSFGATTITIYAISITITVTTCVITITINTICTIFSGFLRLVSRPENNWTQVQYKYF